MKGGAKMVVPCTIAMLLVAGGQMLLQAQKMSSILPDRPAFSLTVRATQSEAKVGEPIIVDITLTNTSDKSLGVPIEKRGYSEFTYDFYASEATGAEAPSTPYLRALRNERQPTDPDIEIAYSTKVWIVQPGKSVTTHMDIARLYNIDVPGTYTVRAERLDKSTGIRVESNTVSVTINP
jgi:hypothetical protein